MAKCEALYVEFITDRVVPWGTPRTVVSPRERGVDDEASGHTGRAVALIGCEILARVDSIAEQSVAPFDRAHNLLCVRIQQQLIRVEAQAFFRIVGPIQPITVEKAGPGLREIAVPDLIRPPAHRSPLGPTPPFVCKKTKLDPFRGVRKQRQIHTLSVPGGPQWWRLTAPDRCFRAVHENTQWHESIRTRPGYRRSH